MNNIYISFFNLTHSILMAERFFSYLFSTFKTWTWILFKSLIFIYNNNHQSVYFCTLGINGLINGVELYVGNVDNRWAEKVS